MKRVVIALTLLFSVLASNSYAGSIGVADFTNPSIFTYEGLGLSTSLPYTPTPITLGGNIYTSNDGVLRYSQFTGCYSGYCIGTSAGLSYIEIVFGTPIQMAGGWIGISSGNVEFFGTDGSPLGSLSVVNNPLAANPDERREFAGWDAGDELIKKIRITDTASSGYVITFDNLYTEGASAVPIPPTVWLLGSGLIGLVGLRRKFFRK